MGSLGGIVIKTPGPKPCVHMCTTRPYSDHKVGPLTYSVIATNHTELATRSFCLGDRQAMPGPLMLGRMTLTSSSGSP